MELFLRDKPSIEPTVRTPPLSPWGQGGRRTEDERKDSIVKAKRNESSNAWARCLLAHCYSLWFIHLPAYIKGHHNKAKVLHDAYEVLCKIEKKGVKLPDEVCYRVLMQLCGQFGHPALAVKVLFEMKRQNITPNAVTYGYYNRAVVEGKWPSNTTSSHLWNKVRNFFAAVHEFRKLAQCRQIARGEGEGSMSPSSSNSDVDSPDSPKKKGVRSRTPTREKDRLISCNEQLLDDFRPDLDSPRPPHMRFPRERTVSEMSNFSESGDLDTSLTSIDGFNSFRRPRRNYDRTISETSMASAFSDGSRHSRLFINNSSEGVDQSEPYEDTTVTLDDYIFGLPHGLKLDTALEAVLGTCSQCIKCERYMYDEEIMAGWEADDSNLNTSCSFCKTHQVASLTIKVKDYRNCFSSRPNSELAASMSSLGSPDVSSVKMSGTLLPLDTPDDEDYDIFESHSKSVPTTIEAGLMIPKYSPPRSVTFTPPSSNPVAIRRQRHSISAPSSANASPTGSFHGSPRQGGMFPRARNSNSTCSSHWFVSRPPEERDNITVAYISPLVLRKELENMLENDGDASLQSPDMVHQKDIIYWNLVWIFKRLDLRSHLPDLMLSSYPGDKVDKTEERRVKSSSEVMISTSWDADRQDIDSIPMYILWNSPVDQQENAFTPRGAMQTVVAHVQSNDVFNPIKILLDERNRQRDINPQIRWSVYRELMFLSITACGADRIDVEAFDREYRRAYNRLRDSKDCNDKLIPEDRSPTAKMVYCRRLFSNPTLQPKLPQFLNNAPLI